MKKAENIISGLTRYIGVVIILFSILAFLAPSGFSWATNYTSWFLGAAMFGMGLTIKTEDFKAVLVRPKEIIIGCITGRHDSFCDKGNSRPSPSGPDHPPHPRKKNGTNFLHSSFDFRSSNRHDHCRNRCQQCGENSDLRTSDSRHCHAAQPAGTSAGTSGFQNFQGKL